MKTQNANSKLRFHKNSLTELNSLEMNKINGGSTIIGGETCSGCVCFPTQQILTRIDAK